MSTSVAVPVPRELVKTDLSQDDPFLFRRVKTWLFLFVLLLMAAANEFATEQPKELYDPKHLKDLGTQSGSLVYFTIAMAAIGAGVIATSIGPTIRQMLRQKHVMAFAVLAIISTAWSEVPDQTIRKAIMLSFMMMCAWFFSQYYSPADQVRLLLTLGMTVALLSMAWVVLLPRYGVAGSGEGKGIFGQKNLLGSSIVFLLSVALFVPLSSRGERLKWLAISVLPLGLLYMSKSRTSWILAVLMVAFKIVGPMIVRLRKEVVPFYLFASLLGLLVVFAGLSEALSLVGRDLTLTGRVHEWQVIFPFALDRFWFGYGYQGFWTGLTGYSGEVTRLLHVQTTVADNGYLDLMLQFGVVGLGLLAFMLAIGTRDFFRLSRRVSIPPVAFWYAGIIFITCFGSITEGMFWMPVRILPFLLAVAFAGLGNLSEGRDLA